MMTMRWGKAADKRTILVAVVMIRDSEEELVLMVTLLLFADYREFKR